MEAGQVAERQTGADGVGWAGLLAQDASFVPLLTLVPIPIECHRMRLTCHSSPSLTCQPSRCASHRRTPKSCPTFCWPSRTKSGRRCGQLWPGCGSASRIPATGRMPSGSENCSSSMQRRPQRPKREQRREQQPSSSSSSRSPCLPQCRIWTRLQTMPLAQSWHGCTAEYRTHDSCSCLRLLFLPSIGYRLP